MMVVVVMVLVLLAVVLVVVVVGYPGFQIPDSPSTSSISRSSNE